MKIPEKNVQNIDIPELQETYVDSIGLSVFDATGAKITFCVTRMNEPNPPKPPTAKRYPACRMVLTHTALIDLYNGLNNMMSLLEKQGLVKREGPKIISQEPAGKPN